MTAAERWIDEHTDVVDDDGDTVHAAVTVDLNVDSIVTVRRIHASDERPQGLALDADQPLAVGDVANTRMALWARSAPDEVEIAARAGRLTLWNVWEADGTVHAWVGAAGILLDEAAGNTTRLRASDGFGDRTIDLEVEIHIRAT
ncbi:MAG: hypothetical protein CL433_01860 [Acidimicrobiaceae bacterium]|jgi:hypothetical protein|nr:hypothetical protein [Acidimicrobiaceae bacterium]HAB57838.1 hypothetical protein [Acidimicrobiaceae bacterium]